ncbi:hypothetical protein GCM10027290_31330 [Micromonospora sonneratiae]
MQDRSLAAGADRAHNAVPHRRLQRQIGPELGGQLLVRLNQRGQRGIAVELGLGDVRGTLEGEDLSYVRGLYGRDQDINHRAMVGADDRNNNRTFPPPTALRSATITCCAALPTRTDERKLSIALNYIDTSTYAKQDRALASPP